MINAYPLSWPATFPKSKNREPGRFQTKLSAALKNVQHSLSLFASDSGKKVEGLVISSNVTLGYEEPADPGVAIWFTWDGLGVCIPVDKYNSVEANLQAIHHILEARRVELRHGTLALVRATFTGFKALPPPKSWREIMGFPAVGGFSTEQIEARYRLLSQERHPDKGGTAAEMAELSAAKDRAIKEIS